MSISAPNLASSYQEIFTVVARLRSRKSGLPDPALFRTQVRSALQQAEATARSLNYAPEDIQLASFAVVALLDETILNLSNPAFRDWARKPLMLELHNTLHAGEKCFVDFNAALNRGETRSCIDLLEVYFLCLTLGFRGKYSSDPSDQLRAWKDPMAERIMRVRGTGGSVVLGDAHELAPGPTPLPPDSRLTRYAVSAAAGIFLVCGLLFIAFRLVLAHGLTELERTVLP